MKRSETTTTAPSLSTATPASSSVLDDAGQPVVVEALARHVLVGQRHVELPVEGVDVRQRDVDEVLPERDRLRVAALQRDDAAARAVGERGVGVEARLGLAVQGSQRLEVLQVRRARVQHVLGQHPELRAPVAQVVHADDAVTLELEHAHERVADHGRAQVADVHLLGHVGRGVVDGDDLRDGRRRHAEPRVVERLGRPARERLGGEREVDEPGPGDLDRGQRAAGVAERPDHALGQPARRLAELLGQLHGEVRLQVEPRLARRGHQRVDVGQSGLTLDRRPEGGRELMVGRRDHPYEPRAARSPLRLPRVRVPRSSHASPRPA